MPQKRRVLLVGGPLDGRDFLVEEGRDLVTFWHRVGISIRWPFPVPLVRPVSYRRLDHNRFEECRTPTAPGDRDLGLPARQLTIDEETT
jgi:hypothetical protein